MVWFVFLRWLCFGARGSLLLRDGTGKLSLAIGGLCPVLERGSCLNENSMCRTIKRFNTCINCYHVYPFIIITQSVVPLIQNNHDGFCEYRHHIWPTAYVLYTTQFKAQIKTFRIS